MPLIHLFFLIDGTITSTVSANTDAGFSIVKWQGTGNTSDSVGHGLNQAPDLYIVKKRNNTSQWYVYAQGAIGNNALKLNSTDAASSYGWISAPTSTTFNAWDWDSSSEMITYCFHSVDGYQKIGSYTGNGSANGPMVETGFEPSWIIIKEVDQANHWNIYDNKRTTTNPRDKQLQANLSDAESTNTSIQVDFLSNGFQCKASGGGLNRNNSNYIYLAIAADAQPAPVLANSFQPVIYTGNGGTQSIATDFKPDLVWVKNREQPDNHRLVDSIRGATNYLVPNLSNAENTSATNITSFDSNGFSVGAASSVNTNNEDYVAWCWKAAGISTINDEGDITSITNANQAAGFSIVSYAGNSQSSATIGHGLSSAPELIITKPRNFTAGWPTMVKTSSTSLYGLRLNTSGANDPANGPGFYNNTAPTDSVYTVGGSDEVNDGYNYISYCFHSVDGYQKIGSYSMSSGVAVTVDVGFQPRFVLLKEANRSAGWVIVDNQRNLSGNYKARLFANESVAESSGQQIQFIGNTFKINWGSTGNNDNGGTGIYLAIA